MTDDGIGMSHEKVSVSWYDGRKKEVYGSLIKKSRLHKDKLELRAVMCVPLMIDDELEGSCVFSMVREKRQWSADTVAELKLIAENLALAVARARAVAEIENLKDQLQEENLYLREEVRLAHGFGEIVGEDPALRRCLHAVEKVAPIRRDPLRRTDELVCISR